MFSFKLRLLRLIKLTSGLLRGMAEDTETTYHGISMGGHITTTVRRSAIASVIEYGVNDIIVNDIEDFIKELQKRPKFDVVFNTIGTVLHDWCKAVCMSNGTVISMVGGGSVSDKFGIVPGFIYAILSHIRNLFLQTILLGNDLSWSNCEVTAATLTKIRQLVEAEQMAPLIDSIWEFEDYKKAFEHAFRDTLQGKVVIKME